MTLFEKKWNGNFYDAWESKPAGEREAFIRAELHRYIEHARKSSYYQSVLEAYDPKSEFPLGKVPVLNASDLRTLVPPQGDALVLKNDGNYTVFQSGGTTGTPKSTLFSNAELDGLDHPNARGFYACGLKPTDRVGNVFAVGSLYMTFVHINRMLQQYGCTNFPFSNHTNTEFIHTVTKLFQLNVFTGISSVVLNALRAMANLGADGIKIDKIYFGGEHLYEADKREIQEKFGTTLVLAPGYGTVDTWYIGYQCEKSTTGIFHAHDDQAYIELINEDTSQPAAKGEPGMMYVTAFPRKLTPIVRYRVGDRALWLKEACACGRTTPLFRLLGRGDDVLRVGYDSVDYNAIQEAVLKVSGLSGTVQMEKKRVEGKDELIIRVETDLLGDERDSATLLLKDTILASRPSLGDFVKKGTVHPLKVELVDPGTLARNPKTGKLIRVIDAKVE